MASIIQRGNAWQCKIRVVGQKTVSQTFPTRDKAEKWAAAQEVKKVAEPTVADFMNRYIEHVAPTKRTAAFQIRLLNRLMRTEKALCSIAVGKLSRSHLAEWRDRRLKAVKSSSFCRELDIIASVYRVAILDEWHPSVTTNPTKGFRRPELPLPRDIRLSHGDDERMIAEALEFNREIAPAIILAIEAAMRQGEIAGLRWENIDLEARTAFIPMTKNGTARKVPLSTKAIEALSWCAPPHTGRVFKLTQSGLAYAFRVVRERCGLKHVHFHDLRHEAASRLVERNALNILEVASVTGHKNLRYLQRYVHIRAEDLAKKLG